LSAAQQSVNPLFVNLRHAAALALVGWYLIVPPVLTWESKQTQLANLLAEHWEIIETHALRRRA